MERRYHAISLLLVMLVMVVSAIGVLALVSARKDVLLSQRQLLNWRGMQDCENQAQAFLRDLPAVEDEGETWEALFTDESGHMLSVVVRYENGGWTILEWKRYAVWDEEKPIGNLLSTND